MEKVGRILNKSLDKILSGMAVFAILMMLLLATFVAIQVFSRYVLNTHILGLFDLSIYCLIAFTFLIPAYTLRENQHVTVDVITSHLPGRMRESLEFGVSLVSLAYPIVLIWCGLEWASGAFSRKVMTVAGLSIPKGILISTIPLGCFFLALQIIRTIIHKIRRLREGDVTGSVWYQRFIAKPPGLGYFFIGATILCLLLLSVLKSTVGLVILALFLLLSGMPVFMVLGILGYAGLYLMVAPETIMQSAMMAYKAVDKFSLTCLPLFILGGMILERGKVIDNVFEFLELFFGRFASGLLIITIVIGGFFCAVSGSSVGSTGAVAAVTLPILIKRGYRKSLSSGTVAGSTIGLLIPPSMAYILYGVITDESIAQLFMGGLGPATILFSLYFIYIITRGVISKKSLFEKEQIPDEGGYQKITWGDRISALKKALWGLFTPVVVLGGIYIGVFTPTEAAAVMVVYAIVVCVFIIKTLTWRDLIGSALRSAEISSMILCIISAAMILGAVVSQLRIAVSLATYASTEGLPIFSVLSFIFLVLFILGMFIDGASIMVITLPIFFPLAMEVGINSVWFGVFYTLTIEIGLLTPPVGLNLFMIKGISGLPLYTVIKGTIPFLLLMILCLIVMYFYPQIVLWLPGTMIR